jgi:ribosome-interacting GTPase 1
MQARPQSDGKQFSQHSCASEVLREYRISNAQVSIRCNATMDDIIDTLEARVYEGVETR